ncbi:hypothetical protein BH11PSE6_BH11PSE6_10220 [soil metagenome]
MPLRTGQPNFSKGELAEDLIARVDVAAYATGLRRARNVTILKYGGVTKRPGTRLVAEVYQDTLTATFTGSISGAVLTVTAPVTGIIGASMAIGGAGVPEGLTIVERGTGTGGAGTYSLNMAVDLPVAATAITATMDSPVRLVPFQFSLEQTYALEMGQGYMRPAALGGMVIEDKLTIASVTTGATTTVQAAYHDYAVGDQVYFDGVAGMVELNGRIARVVSVGDSSHFTVDIDSTGFSAFTADTGGAIRAGAPPPPPPPPPVPPPPPPPAPPSTTPPGNCVVDDTPILMADGTRRFACIVRAGDMIRARPELADGSLGDWGDYPVSAISFAWEPVYAGIIDDRKYRATADHRFWIGAGWICMREIGTADGFARVAKITVEDARTYACFSPDM